MSLINASNPSFMGFSWGSALALALTLGLGLALTQPVELRPRRWRKIIPSLFLVFLVTGDTFSAVAFSGQAGAIVSVLVLAFILGVLAFLWAGNLNHCVAGFSTNLMDSMNSPAFQMPPDLRSIYLAIKQEAFAEALALAQQELKNHPEEFELQVLTSRLQFQLGKRKEAAQTIQRALNNPLLIDGQKRLAAEMLQAIQAPLAPVVKAAPPPEAVQPATKSPEATPTPAVPPAEEAGFVIPDVMRLPHVTDPNAAPPVMGR